jgi:hypothetical protein
MSLLLVPLLPSHPSNWTNHHLLNLIAERNLIYLFQITQSKTPHTGIAVFRSFVDRASERESEALLPQQPPHLLSFSVISYFQQTLCTNGSSPLQYATARCIRWKNYSRGLVNEVTRPHATSLAVLTRCLHTFHKNIPRTELGGGVFFSNKLRRVDLCL